MSDQDSLTLDKSKPKVDENKIQDFAQDVGEIEQLVPSPVAGNWQNVPESKSPNAPSTTTTTNKPPNLAPKTCKETCKGKK